MKRTAAKDMMPGKNRISAGTISLVLIGLLVIFLLAGFVGARIRGDYAGAREVSEIFEGALQTPIFPGGIQVVTVTPRPGTPTSIPQATKTPTPAANTAKLVGLYVNKNNPEEYLQVNKDGTFTFRELAKIYRTDNCVICTDYELKLLTYTGKWEFRERTISGDVLTLRLAGPYYGVTLGLELKGDTLYDKSDNWQNPKLFTKRE